VPAAPERDDPEVYTANKAKLSRAVPISGTLAEDYRKLDTHALDAGTTTRGA
jgi:hypothetical protein